MTNQNGTRVVNIDEKYAPFSFFNIAFIHKTKEDCYMYNEIIAHEQVHINEYHTIDNIIMEILCILQWFNPFVWLCKRSLREIHEYLADKGVVLKGFDRVNYERLMLYNSFGIKTNELTHYFDHSIIKKRIIMLTKQSKSSNVKLKLLSLFPMLLLLVIILYNCDKASDTGNIQDSNVEKVEMDQVYDVVDVMPEYDGGFRELRLFLAQNLIYPVEAQEKGIQGKVFVEFVVNTRGKVSDVKIADSRLKNAQNEEIVVVSYANNDQPDYSSSKASLEKEAMRVIQSLPDFKPGKHQGKNVNVRFTIPISFALQQKQE